MSTRRAEPITQYLLDNTILHDWFEPMQLALGKVRFTDDIFRSLPMKSFVLLGGLRQLLCLTTLREHMQALFHLDSSATQLPVARSTWSDAMASPVRRAVLQQACAQLVTSARSVLPDKLAGVEGIGQRPIIAIDATYQTESSHYHRVLPKEGGLDNQKGHMLLTCYDLRSGMPVDVRTETESMGEMRVLKAWNDQGTDWSRVRNAIYVVDRAFIDGRYWDERKRTLKATVITRLKSTLVYTIEQTRDVAVLPCNERVISDTAIALKSSQEPWRLIEWCSPEGVLYRYITNDFSLEPGVVAFLYYRRWDCEKFYDNFKHDMAGMKAWGKSPIAIEQQALLGIMTYILTLLFVHKQSTKLDIKDNTQVNKQAKKQAHYVEQDDVFDITKGASEDESLDDENEKAQPILRYDAYRAFWTGLSKITKQVWRFLKSCYQQKSSPRLYERQLRPMFEGYL